MKTNIPQVCPYIEEDEIKSVIEVLNLNWITEGQKTKEFSEELNKLIGVKYGVFAPNGTLALFLGLLALGIGPGDEVLVPDITFIGSANAVLLAGAKPRFIEVKKRNYLIDLKEAEKNINEKTKAIMPVHLYGMSVNMEEVIEFAKKYNLLVIEDAAQGIGVKFKNKHTGTFGHIGCFSFFADKTITTGEGGYVVCQTEEIYKKLLLLRNQGRFDRGSFIHPAIGYNFRITDLQAAIGIAQINKLNVIIRRKLEIYSRFKMNLSNCEGISFLEIEENSNFVPFRVVIFVENAKRMMDYLASYSVQPRSFFYPLHSQPCFIGGEMKHISGSNFENSDYGFNHGLCLPVFPTLKDEEIDYIANLIKEFLNNEK